MPAGYVGKKALLSSAFFFLFLAKTFSAHGADCAAAQVDAYARVSHVYDGDTLRLDDGRKLRFIGINTPELAKDNRPDEPLAQQARERLSALIPAGTKVALVYGKQHRDRHRRTLAHVFTLEGNNVSATLLSEGLAFAIVVPPNDGYVTCYFRIEQQARELNKGVWSHPYYYPADSDSLPGATRGFKLVKGKITRIGQSKKNIWLDMGNNFSLKLARKNLHYFTSMPVEQLNNKRISVRGWVSHYNDKLRMSLNHPAMMEILQ